MVPNALDKKRERERERNVTVSDACAQWHGDWALGTVPVPGIIWNRGFPDAEAEPTQATKPAWGLPLEELLQVACAKLIEVPLGSTAEV